MILIKMNRLFYFFGAFLLLGIPMLVPALGYVDLGAGDIEIAQISQLVPLIIIVEIAIYFIIGLIAGAAPSTFKLIQYCAFMVLLRFIFCLFGGSIYSSFRLVSHPYAVLLFWVGNPILALLQIFLIMVYGPYLSVVLGTSFIGEEGRKFLFSGEEGTRSERGMAVYPEVVPVGGFVHVYDFPELGRHLSNVIGMEGYVLYTWEGLILWQDCPLRFNIERLVVRFQTEWRRLQQTRAEIGFGSPERTITETKDHRFIHVTFDEQFFGIMIVKKEADLGDVLGRLRFLERSAKELLDTRYSLSA